MRDYAKTFNSSNQKKPRKNIKKDNSSRLQNRRKLLLGILLLALIIAFIVSFFSFGENQTNRTAQGENNQTPVHQAPKSNTTTKPISHTQKTTQPDQQLQAITTPKPQTTATNKQANNNNTQAVKPESSTVNKGNDTAKTTKEKVSTEDNNALKFTFYDALTHKTVKVDANPKVIKKYRYTYMLQVGSYRNKSDANAIRARLILSGLKPTISKIGDWYRLDVGPVYNKRDGDIIKHKVEAAGISGSLLRQVAKEEITDNNTQNNKTDTQS